MREPLNRFSVAMQQIVAICRAIDLSAKVLILDEPTASLDTQEVELLFDLMRQLRDRGVSLILSLTFSIRSIRSAIGSPSYATAVS